MNCTASIISTQKGRVGYGRAFLRRVALLLAIQIPMELSKVATKVYGILLSRGLTPRLVIGGLLLVFAPLHNKMFASPISD